jgi:hypothetical protein
MASVSGRVQARASGNGVEAPDHDSGVHPPRFGITPFISNRLRIMLLRCRASSVRPDRSPVSAVRESDVHLQKCSRKRAAYLRSGAES